MQYRVVVPEDIPGGSQYAVLWAQIINNGEVASGIQTVGQVGTVITGRSSGEAIESGYIHDVDMTRFAFSGPLTASAKVNNEGNTDFIVKYSYVARTLFGKEVYNQDGTLAAYPETDDYAIEVKWEDTPLLGLFKVDFTIEVPGQDPHVESHVVIILPLVVLILLILLLTIVIVWIIIVIRKRKERKARKLV